MRYVLVENRIFTRAIQLDSIDEKRTPAVPNGYAQVDTPRLVCGECGTESTHVRVSAMQCAPHLLAIATLPHYLVIELHVLRES